MKTLIVILLSASCAWSEMCWKKTPEGVRQEVACAEDQKKWTLDEVAPGKNHQPDWQTGLVKTVDAPNMAESDRKWDESVKKEMDSAGKKP